jgi:hypothetical protein
MKKFQRFNKLTQAKEDYISIQGNLDTLTPDTVANKESGKLYFRFNATLKAPHGPMKVSGQLYEALVPHLGGMPKVGTSLEFNTRLSDIQEGFNTRWGIGGTSVDDTDDLLAAINAM